MWTLRKTFTEEQLCGGINKCTIRNGAELVSESQEYYGHEE
jgi:hypothetical protein